MKDKLFSLIARPTIVKMSISPKWIFIFIAFHSEIPRFLVDPKKLSYTLCENTNTKKCQDAFDEAQVIGFGCT